MSRYYIFNQTRLSDLYIREGIEARVAKLIVIRCGTDADYIFWNIKYPIMYVLVPKAVVSQYHGPNKMQILPN